MVARSEASSRAKFSDPLAFLLRPACYRRLRTRGQEAIFRAGSLREALPRKSLRTYVTRKLELLSAPLRGIRTLLGETKAVMSSNERLL